MQVGDKVVTYLSDSCPVGHRDLVNNANGVITKIDRDPYDLYKDHTVLVEFTPWLSLGSRFQPFRAMWFRPDELMLLGENHVS